MNRVDKIQHKFVRTIPNTLEEGVVYISIEYGTVVHKCCCGCGEEIVTPLTPTDWKLIFDGEAVSLYPSIGNWSFDCRSHYWIRDNHVQWAGDWSQSEVEAGRKADRQAKTDFYESKANGESSRPAGWTRFWSWLSPSPKANDEDAD